MTIIIINNQSNNNNSPIQDYIHPDDQTQPTFEITPGFKPFTVLSMLCRQRGGRQGMGWEFDCLCWPWGGAFDWSCSPRGGDIWIFLRPTWRFLTADSDEKDLDRTYVSRLHASRMRHTVWKSWRPTGTSESLVDFTLLSSNFVCFSVFLINWTS